MSKTVVLVVARCFVMVALLPCFMFSIASAQLNENCTVTVLNRTVNVKPDGSWQLNNVPSNMGRVRVRVTCVEDGKTVSGQSEYVTIQTNGNISVEEMFFNNSYEQVPTSLTINSEKSVLSAIGETTRISVLAMYPDGSTKDVTLGGQGTAYTVSNQAIATVNSNGLVTAISSGNIIISASNEMVLSSIFLSVQLSGDSDGDGLPDDFELTNGLNPNNPVDSLEDMDEDGLTNLEEFDLGTGMNNADTDGDGISDGEEIVAGDDGYVTNPLLGDSDGDGIWDGLEVSSASDPNDAGSFDLAATLDFIKVTPSNFALTFNTIMGESTKQLTVTGTFTDGNTIDLTPTGIGTNYSSSDLVVANFGVTAGLVYAGTDGTAVITVTNNGFSDTAVFTVETFSPTPLSYVDISGFANNVDVGGDYAYVAAGSTGLQVVDVSDRVNPAVVASEDTLGNANDVKVDGALAYIADGVSGLQIMDISNPLDPVTVGSVDTPGDAYDVAVSGIYAYVADGNAGLQIINVSVSNNPVIEGTVVTSNIAKGVDIDPEGNLAVVADGSAGVQVIDITTPSNAGIIGTVDTNGNARDVVLRNSIAYVSDYTGGLKAVNISNPTTPTIAKSVEGNYLMDAALFDSLVFGADVLSFNAVPAYNISIPDDPVFTAIINFAQFRDDDGTGTDADSRYLYLTTSNGIMENGSSGDTRLYIGQYRMVQDIAGVPPTVSITSPLAGIDVIEGAKIQVASDAADDVQVASVSFIIDGNVVFTDTSAPYEFDYTVPLGISGVTISATALDLANNAGASPDLFVTVIPDPLTTILGSLVDINGGPMGGVTVTTVNNLSTTSLPDGTFSISDVPTVQGNIQVTASTNISGWPYRGNSPSIPAVPGGMTDAGVIIIERDVVSITVDTTIVTGNRSMDFKALTVDGANLTVEGPHTFYSITLLNNAKLTHPDTTTTEEYSLDITVSDTLTIDSDSTIDVSGKGYLGGYNGPGNYSYYGRTLGNTTTGGSYVRSGGSYGGLGGQTGSDSVNGVYGSFYNPNELGSGGGGNSYTNGGYGGNGGGLVRITAAEIVLNGNGSIKSNGGDGEDSDWNGGGSGGGIYINVGTIRGDGSGTIAANGGKATRSYSSTNGGGGGRIAVYYDDIAGFDINSITAYGGLGSSNDGGAGTIYLKDVVNKKEQLIGNNSNNTGKPTPLVSEDGNGFTFDDLIIGGGSISIDKLIVNKLTLDAGDSCMGELVVNNVVVGDGALIFAEVMTVVNNLTVDNGELSVVDLSVGNNVTLQNNGILTHEAATMTQAYSSTIGVGGTLAIDSGSTIDVSCKGYLGGYNGSGNYSYYGRTLGNTTTGGSYVRSGGSYGGLGGQTGTDNVNGVYGSFYNPNELGSGGGGNSYTNGGYGGNGGGLVRITAAEIVLNGNGSIKSNGGDGEDSDWNGGGSGGGIYINVGTIRGDGSGTIAANGGKATRSYSSTNGGGGGRIAVYYDDIAGFDINSITAYGGLGSSNDGGAGTIYLKASIQTYGDLIVDNNGSTSLVYSTPLVSVGTGLSSDLTANTLTDSTRKWNVDGLIGIFLNPNTSQETTPATVFRILSNDVTSITVENTLNNLTDVTISGNSYIGEHYFDNLTIINGARVETLDRISFSYILITSGGEIQADNYYQIGKAETSLKDKLAKYQKK
ncbi:Ig-like domain-containing protein [Candidatus Scalindua japonica]|nr:Ig-like domain-containing protein [Candidatus Scalindua japonica]